MHTLKNETIYLLNLIMFSFLDMYFHFTVTIYIFWISETFKLNVHYGKTYHLRMVNAAMNLVLFFAVSKHNLTVVGVDSAYSKPLTRDYICIAPGQTADVLLHANQEPNDYYMAARAFKCIWSFL